MPRSTTPQRTAPPADDPFLPIPEVARQLGISRTSVYDYLNDGRLPREDIGNGRSTRIRVRQSAVTAFKNKARLPIPDRQLPGRHLPGRRAA